MACSCDPRLPGFVVCAERLVMAHDGSVHWVEYAEWHDCEDDARNSGAALQKADGFRGVVLTVDEYKLELPS